MPYIVIARKYRPLTFNDLIGQEAIVTTLKNAIRSNRVAHSYLFTGQRGVGKTSMARIFSKALNCDKGPTISPCNVCDICKSISNGNDVDVLEIDGASNRGIDEVRNIRQNVNYAPSRSNYKIYIIDEVHMLTREAFNALLKTLEEPPPHVKFIFATTAVDRLPETVLSRCQRFDFKNISSDDIENHISGICKKEGIEAEKGVFRLIARYARGGLRDAESVLDQLISFSDGRITLNDVYAVLGTIDEVKMFEVIDGILKKDIKQALKIINETLSNGKGVTEFIDQMVWYLRDLLMASIYKNVSDNDKNVSESQMKLISDHSILSIDKIIYMIQHISDIKKKTRDDLHRRILIEVAIIKLALAEDISPITDILNRLENIEKMLSIDSVPDGLAMRQGSGGMNQVAVISRNSFPDGLTGDVNNRSDKDKPGIGSQGDAISKEGSDINKDKRDEIDNHKAITCADIEKRGFFNNKKGCEISNVDLDSLWSNIISNIQMKRKSLRAIMKEAKLIDYRNGEMVVEYPKEMRIHKERLESPDERRIIEGCAERIIGERVSLRLTLAEKYNRKIEEKRYNYNTSQRPELSRTNYNIDEVEPDDDSYYVREEKPTIVDTAQTGHDPVKKAIKIFGGRIVNIRRMDK